MGILLESMITKAEKAINRAETAIWKASVLEKTLDASILRERELERKLRLKNEQLKEAGLLLIVSNLIWLIVVIAILI